AHDRDPKSWEFQGSNDESNWTTLDTRNEQEFNYRNEFRVFELDNTETFTYYRLTVMANAGSLDIQLREWRLMREYSLQCKACIEHALPYFRIRSSPSHFSKLATN